MPRALALCAVVLALDVTAAKDDTDARLARLETAVRSLDTNKIVSKKGGCPLFDVGCGIEVRALLSVTSPSLFLARVRAPARAGYARRPQWIHVRPMGRRAVPRSWPRVRQECHP